MHIAADIRIRTAAVVPQRLANVRRIARSNRPIDGRRQRPGVDLRLPRGPQGQRHVDHVRGARYQSARSVR